MVKSVFNQIYHPGATSKRFITMLFLLALLAVLNLAGASPTAAQEPAPSNTIYLPIIIKSGTDTAAGPYAQMLQMVQQKCAGTGLNQVCYVNGQVTLQPESGPVTFSQPGAIADLANVQSLSLTSSGPDIQTWGLAWLRLRANAGTPDQGLTILAYGNVQISNIALFESQASLSDTVTLPSLQFVSSPVAGVTTLGNSGLIVSNPTDSEVLSLTLNGAAISLGSTALVEAQPGNQMTVTMATGASLTDVNGQGSTAVQNQQVSVPLNQSGQAAGPPTPARSLTDNEIIDQHLHDAFLRIIADPSKWANSTLTHLNQALDRCIAGQAAYVYNVLYWIRIIENTPSLKSLLDPSKLTQAYNRVPKCLSFEVDFDSTVSTTTSVLHESSHTQAQGLPIEFSADGSGVSFINAVLKYPSYEFTPSQSCGPITTQTTTGQLAMITGSLQIVGNKVRVSMVLKVAIKPTDMVTITCTPPAPPLILNENHWVDVFYNMHQDLQQADVDSFRFNDWKYTGGTHFSEAIYVRTRTESGFTFDSTTFLILVHMPR